MILFLRCLLTLVLPLFTGGWCLAIDGGQFPPPITSAVFADGGRTLVTCSQAGLHVYSWPKLELVRQISLRASNQHQLAISPLGTQLAIGGGNPAEVGMVEILSWPEGNSTCLLADHSDSVMSLQWIDENTLVSGSLDKTIILWDVPAAKQMHVLVGHSAGVSALCYLPAERILVSAGIDQSLRVWNVDSRELTRNLPMHTLPVHCLVARPVDVGLPMVASASEDRTVRLWQPTLGRMVRFARLPARPLALTWLNDGQLLATACDNGRIYTVDPNTVQIAGDIVAWDGWIYAIAAHPSDGSLVVAGSGGELRRIELTARSSN